ncbi:hypothetical protein K503DRAFT_860726 [Rhizopogon vinicolor AM-OR11-026]|uniref:Uncharacterized protein n=1 Tax=Rhizopogon vinicolor AM-OR11-026 TaxID=1314800 RepID=A0A1B7MFW2_9AGAM|nr:hypothetical protein K503DRAFT_860726 [Rhizopogon vinicolor AM-OR11-026]
MNFPDSSSCRRRFEEHPAEPYHVTGSAHRFAFRSEENFWFGYQDHDFSMQAAVPTDTPLEVGILIDGRTALYPSSKPPSSSGAPEVEEPHLMQSTCTAAAHDEYAAHACAPVINGSSQGFMGDGPESHAHCPLPPSDVQWRIGEQDAITHWESSSVIDHNNLPACWEPSSAVGHHHVPAVGGDMMISSAAHSTQNGNPLAFRCRHHTRGQPCGLLIEGDIQDALEHFAHVHVRPMVARSGSNFWTCRWGGKCNTRVCKGNFRRHVAGHLFRWKCLKCLRTYSRDDSARKHANDCGDGSIIMVPPLDGRLPKRKKRSGGKGKEHRLQATTSVWIIVVLSREAYQGSTRGPDAATGVVGHNMRLRWCWHKGKVRSAKCFPPSDNTIPPQASGVIHRSSPAELGLEERRQKILWLKTLSGTHYRHDIHSIKVDEHKRICHHVWRTELRSDRAGQRQRFRNVTPSVSEAKACGTLCSQAAEF